MAVVTEKDQQPVWHPYVTVEVLWWDHWQNSEANVTPSEAEVRAGGPASVHSTIGYLVGESDDQYLLSDTLCYWSEGDVSSVRGYRGILKTDVIDVRVCGVDANGS